MGSLLSGPVGKPLPVDAVSPHRAAMGAGPETTAMKLTPQEQNIWLHHLYNAAHVGTGGGVRNPDGSISTVFQMSVEGPDGKTYNIPTVWGGKILSPHEALQMALGSGRGWQYWPSYESEEAAQSRYDQMHQYLEAGMR